MKFLKLFLFIYFSTIAFLIDAQKINGVSYVNPFKKMPLKNMDYIVNANAEWLAVIPFGFSKINKPQVNFDSNFQWYGEKVEGTKYIINQTKESNLKVMLKPHVWLSGSWVGSFDLQSESDWKIWEKDYRDYIITFAKIAAECDIEMFCIGTEYKIAAVKREQFFRSLIKEIKTFYKGKLVYAANWDNYENIKFWDDLDFIGIDSYFPLSKSKTPTVKELVNAWQHKTDDFESFSAKFNKQILFTEFGYMSCDYTANKNWENEKNKRNLNVNLQAQNNAYIAYFKSLYPKNWFAGGFLWKWFPNYNNAGGINNKDYTPQNKPVEKIIKKYYGLN